ncbi:hypothetical protein CC80DRAFT_465620 [Byssothecium circinans]|uniref:G domain-containing protein n=1 Tax=Byssothecium circinans TaxID=147558 RepID=A0A6A5U5A2_9PLEO|nr:hypothetical protein CC80DRAFT_465620 [Byssothecium circinans]
MENDVVVAVMGLTGVGKSTFIRNVTGRTDIIIGHGLTSQTSEVCGYSFKHRGRQYHLIDTPGFNDTFESDKEITMNILKWLESSYRAGTQLSGIVYLHNISTPRIAGSALENLIMFRKLCGEEAMSNVLLATTFWGTSDNISEEKREKVLIEDKTLWGRMTAKGSKALRLEDSRQSALAVLDVVSPNSKVTLQAQIEMVDEGKTYEDTSAARFVALSCESGFVNERRKRMRAETLARTKRLEKMKEELKVQDDVLSQVEEELENEQGRLKNKRRDFYATHKCRCKLVGRIKCAGCRGAIGKVFYRKLNDPQ